MKQLVGGACCLLLGMLLGNRLPSNGTAYWTAPPLEKHGSVGAPPYFLRAPPRSKHDQQVLAEMAVHPGMLAANPAGTVAVVLAEDATSQVICEVLRHQSVHRILLFPPASSAPSAAPPAPRFSATWPCADNPRVVETQWTGATASTCKSVDVLIIDAVASGDTVPASTVNAAKAVAWKTIKCLLTEDATVMFQVGPAPTVWERGQLPSAKATAAEQLQLIAQFGKGLQHWRTDDDAEDAELNVHIFDTFVAADNRPRSYAVICKGREGGIRWNRNEACEVKTLLHNGPS